MAVVYFINQLHEQLLLEAQPNEVLPRHEQIAPGNHVRKFYCKCCDHQFWVQNARGHFLAAKHTVNVVGCFTLHISHYCLLFCCKINNLFMHACFVFSG